ncbi:MAG: sodium:solute symporter family protein [Candidatus Neomarinimicrobiota bacterium]
MDTSLHTIDWTIIAVYILFSIAVGVYFTKRASKNTEEYFLSGRSLPWWIVGTSMVATTFAADTPLAITEFIRGAGIWQNWFWWNQLLAGLLAVFLFSRLWRRARVLTDNELLEIRYSGKPAAFLRGFKAAYFGILYNFIVMGWVINAMASVAAVMLNIDRWTAVWICVAIALLYALLAGFWGVVVTDFVQFGIAMFGSIALAIIAVNAMGGMDNLLTMLNEMIPAASDTAAATTITTNTLKFIPPVPDADFFTMEFWESPFSKFLVFLTILWWSRDNSDGGGYIIQRMSSAKNEKHALLATLWFNLTHYAFRVWPWILVAMVSIVAFPDVSEWALGDKVGYPLVMQKFLGPGMKGLLVVSFLAAFMSTIDTHLNWGASYLINDIYKRFIKPEKSFSDQSKAQRHYVLVSRILTVFLMIFAALIAVKMQSIGKAWEFIFAMGAGIGLVLILRWFWWRINAWTEISALITSILITVTLEIIAGIQTVNAGMTYTLFGRAPIIFGIELQMHHKLLIIVPCAILVWLTVTFLTKPEKDSTLKEFYQRVQPGGWWKPISKDIPRTKANVTKGFLSNWLAGIAFIFGATFAIGNLIFGNWGNGLLLTAISILGFAWIWKNTIVKLDSD